MSAQKIKIVYCGYDLFADCLEMIPALGVEVMAIYTFPSDGVTDFHDRVRAFAQVHNIPFTVGRVSEVELDTFAARGCDYLVSAGYAYRIPVREGGLRGINLHPALLPIGRGAWPMPVTILRGLSESGVTLHKLAPRFDEGDILAQRSFQLSPDETLSSLTAKLQREAPVLLAEFFASPEQMWQAARPQGAGEYWPQPGEAEMMITPATPVEDADRILRAFEGIGCFYLFDGQRIPMRHAEITQIQTPWPICGAYLQQIE